MPGTAAGGGTGGLQAAGISALALLQLQKFSSSLAPAPKPLPATGRLASAVLRSIQHAAATHHVAWTLIAAIARQESNFGASSGAFAGRQIGLHGTPARTLAALAGWLAAHGAGSDSAAPFASLSALNAYFGSADAAERTAALAAYYWGIGDAGLTHGLATDQTLLEQRALADNGLGIYRAGRSDITQHRIDPRVLMTIRYLEAGFGRVDVSSLITGHPIFTATGGVSAHVFGRAVDVIGLGGTPIRGNQGPQTVTEHAIRLLLMLPADVAPRQIISLMSLGGGTSPNTGSFALPDAADHIQISY